MTADLTNPIFQDETAAREHFEKLRWPDGPVCPHCGNVNRTPARWDAEDRSHIAKMKGKSHRPGLYWCFACKDSFTVTVGTVMERSHIPLHKWALAFHLMAASKKGISAHQLHRMLGINYKSAWFMAHRIREAMISTSTDPMGGPGKAVEADETYIGRRKGKEVRQGGGHKMKVVTLVQRNGAARSVKVENVTAKEVTAIINQNVSPKAMVATDESLVYKNIYKTHPFHATVNHSKDEWRKGDAYTNTVEGFFSIFKRGMRGVYQHCSERHLQRYLNECDFRYSNRIALGVDDKERAARAIKGAEGKRLMFKATKE